MPVELTWIRQSIMLEVGVACKLLGLHVLNVAAHQATVRAGGPCDARGELVCLFVLHETHEVQLDKSSASRHQGDQHTNFKVEAGGIVKVFQNYSQESGHTSLHNMLNVSPQKPVIQPAELPCTEPVRQLGNAPIDTLQLIALVVPLLVPRSSLIGVQCQIAAI